MQTKIILNRFLTACITTVLLMTSCEIQENFKYEPSGVDGVLDVTAWSFIQANDDFDQLERAITRTGLQNLYQDEERTFIVPNNTAFEAYLQSSGYSSIEDIPLPILRNMLRYHIVKERVIFTDPTIVRDQPLPYETENGQTLFLSRNNNYVGLINQGTARQWEIRTSNLEPTNGVIHAVDFIVYFSAPAIDDSEDPTLVRDTIYPLADSFVAGDSPGELYANTNYGANPLLRPKYSSPALNSAYDRFAYLMFNLDDFEKPGIVVDMRLRLAVSFTTGDGYPLNLYQAANNNWSESTITFNNAPGRVGNRISYLTTSKVDAFNFDITNFYKNESPSGRVSFMLESGAAPAGNKTDDLASKEHATLPPPMIIATLVTNQNVLVVETNEPISVSNGGSVVINTDLLELSGADAADIIYTVEVAPEKGWLIRGADIIGQGGEFMQTDLRSLSLLYIHDGESNGEDTMLLSARDRTGAEIEDIEVKINIQ
ncbi:CBM96 family carbohydrate-binding protein [Sphingobacterium phlebotomi]|nr:DNRLRE domain-containing protein [Sphingobacterium phlebotomi]